MANGLKDTRRSVRERLQNLVEVLKASRILMVWDGLELDGKTGKISDPDLAEFYLLMLKGMTAGRVIVTCWNFACRCPDPARSRLAVEAGGPFQSSIH